MRFDAKQQEALERLGRSPDGRVLICALIVERKQVVGSLTALIDEVPLRRAQGECRVLDTLLKALGVDPYNDVQPH